MTERVSRPRVKPPTMLPSMAIKVPDRTPLAGLLEAGFSENSVPVLWHRIQGQLHKTEPTSAWSWLTLRRWPFALAMATTLALLGVWSYSSYWQGDSLRLSSGQLPAALIAEATPRQVSLSDGSQIEIAQQSRLEVLGNDSTTFVTALSRGSATFEVNPKAKRRWIVEVGLTSVEVVGTRFTVTRSDSKVNVSVAKGLVLVRGAAVPGGQQRLGAGQQLSAPTTLEPTAAAPEGLRTRATASSQQVPVQEVTDLDATPAAEEAEPSAAGPTEQDGARVNATSPAEPDATATPAAQTGKARARETGPRKVPPQIEALLEEADRAREAGDIGRSLQHFEQVIAIAPRFDPRRGLAAMSVARMTMNRNPARAAAALRVTLDGMPVALRENATARLVEAYAKSGQKAQAQHMAKRYLESFPNGRRAEDVRRWANP